MNKYLSRLLSLFGREEKREFSIILFLMILMGLLETAGIASVPPFIAIITNPELIDTNQFFSSLKATLNISSVENFIVLSGLVVLAILILGNLFSAYVTRRMLLFSNLQGFKLSRKLFSNYIYQPYEFYHIRNSSELTKNIMSEVGRIVVGILLPILRLISKLILVTFILALLFIANPLVTLLVFAVLGGAYLIVYCLFHNKINLMGKQIPGLQANMYQCANEAFLGIRELKIIAKEQDFIKRFSDIAEQTARLNANSQILTQLPRYFLEIIAFGGLLLLALYYVSSEGMMSTILPYIALFTFSGYRLMPSLQQIFSSLAMIRYNTAALDVVANDFKMIYPTDQDNVTIGSIDNWDKIHFKGISYQYQNSDAAVISELNLTISKKSNVAIVGTTGSGKSTILDILLGLLIPQEGKLMAGDQVIDENNLNAWQSIIGYVPQMIFLIDDSIKNNITISSHEEEIDFERLNRAIEVSRIGDFISTLPDGINSYVGENGINLSGGQRQRIGIARALYTNSQILILDEATSALDQKTEAEIMKSIFDMHDKTKIIVTHRLSAIERCDDIYVLSNGKLVANGHYKQLLKESKYFQHLANSYQV